MLSMVSLIFKGIKFFVFDFPFSPTSLDQQIQKGRYQ